MVRVANRQEHPIFYPQRKYVDMERWGKLGLKLAPNVILNIFKAGSRNSTEYPYGILDQHLMSITIEEDIKMTSQLTISLSNPDWIMSDAEFLSAGTQFEVYLGYSTATIFLGRRFEITNIMPTFPRDGIPNLQIKGYDARHRMTMGEKIVGQKKIAAKTKKQLAKTRRFKNKRDDQIVSEIAEIYDFAVDVDQTDGKRTRVKKRETSDWQFILNIAKFNDFEVWVDFDLNVGWILHFRKEDLKTPNDYYDFVYAEDGEGTLLSANLELEITKQSTDVEVLSYDRRLRKVNTAELSETKDVVVKSIRGGIKGGKVLESVDYGSKVKFSAFGRTMEVISNKPFKSKKDANKYVKTYLKEREKDFLTCTGTVIGTENVRPRQIHKLSGLGAKYSGFYKFIQVTHKWSNDAIYETDFVAYKIVPEDAQLHRKITASIVDFEGSAI